MLTKSDISEIRKALKPDIVSLENNLKLEIQASEKRVKSYIHESADAVLDGVEDMFKDREKFNSQRDSRNLL